MACRKCWFCKGQNCENYNNNDDSVDSMSNYTSIGRTPFSSNNTKQNGGQRPSNSPKGFWD